MDVCSKSHFLVGKVIDRIKVSKENVSEQEHLDVAHHARERHHAEDARVFELRVQIGTVQEICLRHQCEVLIS